LGAVACKIIAKQDLLCRSCMVSSCHLLNVFILYPTLLQNCVIVVILHNLHRVT